MVKVETSVMHTQAYGCWFCLHVGSVAVYFGRGLRGRGPRLEILTPLRRWRWSRGYRDDRDVSGEANGLLAKRPRA